MPRRAASMYIARRLTHCERKFLLRVAKLGSPLRVAKRSLGEGHATIEARKARHATAELGAAPAELACGRP